MKIKQGSKRRLLYLVFTILFILGLYTPYANRYMQTIIIVIAVGVVVIGTAIALIPTS